MFKTSLNTISLKRNLYFIYNVNETEIIEEINSLVKTFQNHWTVD